MVLSTKLERPSFEIRVPRGEGLQLVGEKPELNLLALTFPCWALTIWWRIKFVNELDRLSQRPGALDEP